MLSALFQHACLVTDAHLDWFNQHRVLKIKLEYKDLLFVAFQQKKPQSFTTLHV
jgi:hypothetical protein